MSMAYSEFALFMADVDEAFKTWDKVTLVKLSNVSNRYDIRPRFYDPPHRQ